MSDTITKRGFKFGYDGTDALLRTATVGVAITEPILNYVEQLARSGLYGNTVEDVVERLLVAGIEEQIRRGWVHVTRVDLRRP